MYANCLLTLVNKYYVGKRFDDAVRGVLSSFDKHNNDLTDMDKYTLYNTVPYLSARLRLYLFYLT